MIRLQDYRQFVGDDIITTIYRKMRRLYGRHLLHINSTFTGGGVAEMLQSIVPLMNGVGLDAGWRTLHGNTDFYGITKKFHNALQGQRINFSQMKKALYLQVNEDFSTYTHMENHDFILIHDPQPLPLIRFYKKRQPWIWRCHIDLSQPNPELWEYLKTFILRYDLIIMSSEKYMSKNLPMDYRIIQPAIDPLSHKNKEISDTIISRTLKKHKVPLDRPIITQISRFDKWKDPLGVIDVYKRVRQECDCRLVLCGNMATDDPEGLAIFDKIRRSAKRLIDNRDIILLTVESHILVNALQRKSAVIIQKSLREGFGLTVTEGLWKGRPVVASDVGGIPLQITHGENGFLVDPTDNQKFADHVLEILKNPAMGAELGRNGREIVRKKFLMTRVLTDYLDLLNDLNGA